MNDNSSVKEVKEDTRGRFNNLYAHKVCSMCEYVVLMLY